MKFEFSLTVKAVPMADCHLSIDCNAEELAVMLADPVYQALGAKLINEISFKPQSEQQKQQNDQTQETHNKAVINDLRRLHTQQQKHNENLRRQVEVMQHTMKILEKRIDAYRKNHPDFD